MKPRRLKLESGIWRYLLPSDEHRYVRLWTPAGRLLKLGSHHVFTTCMCSCPPEYQCFGKGFSPGSLREFIETHLL